MAKKAEPGGEAPASKKVRPESLVGGSDPTAPKPTNLAEAVARALAHKAVQDLNKAQGGKAIGTGASIQDPSMFIPTGISQLDYALGGGVAAGRVLLTYGRKSSGKSSLLARIIASGQKLCSRCYTLASACSCGDYRPFVAGIADVEGVFHAKWSKTLGVDPEGILYTRPVCGEEAIDTMDVWVRTGEVDLVALDSIAFLTSLKEQTIESGASTPGGVSILVGQAIRKLLAGSIAVQRATGRLVTIVLLNQMREKVGVMFGSPDTTPGGHAPEFVASAELRLAPAKYHIDETTGLPLWGDFRFTVVKNKLVRTVQMEGEYRMLCTPTEHKRSGDILDEDWIVSKAQELGIVTGAGSSWMVRDRKFGSKSAIPLEMMKNPEFNAELRHLTMSALLERL